MKGKEAERVAQRYLEKEGFLVHRAMASTTKRAGRFICHSNDIFGCIDIVAIDSSEPVYFIQVTTTGGVTKRRRKLEAIAWPRTFAKAQIWEVRTRKNVKDGRRVDYFFRVHDYDPLYESWTVTDSLEIPRSCLSTSSGRNGKKTASQKKLNESVSVQP